MFYFVNLFKVCEFLRPFASIALDTIFAFSLKDIASTVLSTRWHGRSTVFKRMLRHYYPFRIYRECERGLAIAATHARTRPTGRSAQHRFNRNHSTILSKFVQRNARGLSHGHIHAPAGTRAESPSRSLGSRWTLWCGRRSTAFSIPNTFIYVYSIHLALRFFSLFSFSIFLFALTYRSIVVCSHPYHSTCSLFYNSVRTHCLCRLYSVWIYFFLLTQGRFFSRVDSRGVAQSRCFVSSACDTRDLVIPCEQSDGWRGKCWIRRKMNFLISLSI